MRKLLGMAVAGVAIWGGQAFAGHKGGPAQADERVKAFEDDHYKMTFVGGEVAQIYVSGDGSTDLDLYVYDESGHLIAADEDPDDECLVRWTPRWTGKFRVVIVNRGPASNNYYLRTN